MSVGKRLLRFALGLVLMGVLTAFAYKLHAKPFTAGFVYLLPVLLVAFQWGFAEAVVLSFVSIGCLDYFFTEPLFNLYQQDPQDWIALLFFGAIALSASKLAERLEHHAHRADRERTSAERLYLFSHDIIMIEHRQPVGAQLAALIADTFKVDSIALWDAQEVRLDKAGKVDTPDEEVKSAYFKQLAESDPVTGTYRRVLRIGVKPIGALCIVAHPQTSSMDSRIIDAIASLSSIAMERAHAFMAESIAEATKRSEQLRTSVLDGLAHEFKTPLTVIESASSGLLEINRLEDPEKELVSLIDQEVQHLVELTNKVLRLARLDHDNLKLNYVTTSLTELLESCREQCVPVLRDHPLRIIDETAGNTISVDSDLIQMALTQLLDNASKYSNPASTITLHVRLRETDALFRIHNEGSYIPPQERLRIFDRFYRSADTQYKAPGTGIGLSVTRRIAEAHQGSIWVESDPEEGTNLLFTLPLLWGVRP